MTKEANNGAGNLSVMIRKITILIWYTVAADFWLFSKFGDN